MTQEPPREGPPPSPHSPQSPQSPGQAPPPQHGPPQQHHRPGGPAQPGNGIALAAMVVGIVGAVFGTILGFFAITAVIAVILGILAIIFGIIGRRRADANPAVGRKGMGTAGLILGIVSLIGGLLWVVAFGALVDDANNNLDEFNQELEELEEQSTTP